MLFSVVSGSCWLSNLLLWCQQAAIRKLLPHPPERQYQMHRPVHRLASRLEIFHCLGHLSEFRMNSHTPRSSYLVIGFYITGLSWLANLSFTLMKSLSFPFVCVEYKHLEGTSSIYLPALKKCTVRLPFWNGAMLAWIWILIHLTQLWYILWK